MSADLELLNLRWVSRESWWWWCQVVDLTTLERGSRREERSLWYSCRRRTETKGMSATSENERRNEQEKSPGVFSSPLGTKSLRGNRTHLLRGSGEAINSYRGERNGLAREAPKPYIDGEGAARRRPGASGADKPPQRTRLPQPAPACMMRPQLDRRLSSVYVYSFRSRVRGPRTPHAVNHARAPRRHEIPMTRRRRTVTSPSESGPEKGHRRLGTVPPPSAPLLRTGGSERTALRAGSNHHEVGSGVTAVLGGTTWAEATPGERVLVCWEHEMGG